MNNELQISAKAKSAIEQIEAVATTYALSRVCDLDRMEQSYHTSKGIEAMRSVLKGDIMKMYMGLQGHPLGFKTDKVYPEEAVREVLIQAFMHGLLPNGNEFNIIGGNFYATKEGLKRLVYEFAGASDIEIEPGIPSPPRNGTVVVTMTARWKQNDKAQEISRPFAVRANNGQGVDATLGKAHRKLYAAMLERMTGQAISEGEVEPAVERKRVDSTSAPRLRRVDNQAVTHTESTPPSTMSDAAEGEVLSNFDRCVAAAGGDEDFARQYIETRGVPTDDDDISPIDEAMDEVLRGIKSAIASESQPSMFGGE